jgi:hypothetical protein
MPLFVPSIFFLISVADSVYSSILNYLHRGLCFHLLSYAASLSALYKFGYCSFESVIGFTFSFTHFYWVLRANFTLFGYPCFSTVVLYFYSKESSLLYLLLINYFRFLLSFSYSLEFLYRELLKGSHTFFSYLSDD